MTHLFAFLWAVVTAWQFWVGLALGRFAGPTAQKLLSASQYAVAWLKTKF